MSTSLSRALILAATGWLAWNATPGMAQTEPADPEPAPTNAASTLQSNSVVEGVGSLPLGSPSQAAIQNAYQAAVLDGYQKLFWAGAEQSGMLPGNVAVLSRSFRLDAQHPNLALLDWLLRCEVSEQQTLTDRLVVKLKSPPLADLNSDTVHPLRTVDQDIDGDGQPERVVVTYDGRIQLYKSNRLLASSPCLNSLQVTSMRSGETDAWSQVRLSRVTNVSSLEPLTGGKLRVLADLTLGEAVDHRWIGKANEQREVLLRWDEKNADPQIELTEPRDFQLTPRPQVAWKGQLRTPGGLQSAKLRVNGRPFWQTPDRLATQRLRMDILLPLLPGLNRAQVLLTDQNQRSLAREVLLFRDAPCPGTRTKQRRALLVGVDEYSGRQFAKLPNVKSDVQRLRNFLQRPEGGAFDPAQVSVLTGSKATREQILSELRRLSTNEGDERVLVFVYFAGLSAPSAGSGGKGLLPFDAKGFDEGALTPQDLQAAVGELRNQDMVLVADTSSTQLSSRESDQLWLDSQEFAERCAQQGWAVLSSVDSGLDVRDGTQGSRLLNAFLEGCSPAADLNQDGYIEWDEAYRHLFQTVTLSSPGTLPPLRRGDVLGRVPLSCAAKPGS